MPKERQTCTECSMRRQKCDRQIPCTRCVKRGDADKCTREWPEEGYDPRKHRMYPGRQHKSTDIGHAPHSTSLDSKRDSQTSSSLDSSLRVAKKFCSGLDVAGPTRIRPSSGVDLDSGPSNDVIEAASTLDFIFWGKSKSTEIAREPFKDSTGLDRSNGFPGTDATQVAFLQLLLPSKRQIFQLVDYHIDNVLWYHSCFHASSFRQDLEAAAQGPDGLQLRNTDLRWTALMFSIMAGSLVTAPIQTTLSWGFQKEELPKLTRQWFRATLTSLNLADYMWRHHVYSIEAITVLIMSAHILGYSTSMSTLLGTALKIAQGLGLHKLGPDEDEPTYTSGLGRVPMIHPTQRQKIIKRETGRRLWVTLCNQDWFAVGFSDMYSIQKRHFTTIQPISMDDQSFDLLPPEIPAPVQFTRCINDLAALCAQMFDAVSGASTLYTKYEQVLEYDAKIRVVSSSGLPKWLDSREPLESHWPAWVPWARRSFNLVSYHKIIMTHRPFLGRSFTEPAFDCSRRACLATSKSILKEAKQAYDEEGPSFWIDQGFMVAAGIVLALDTFHRQETEPEYEEHRKLAETTANMLGMFENSAIASRGAKMMSTLLTEQARMRANSTLKTYRKRSLENGDDGSAAKRQKFDMPKFLERLYGHDSFTSSLKMPNGAPEPESSIPEPGNNAVPGANSDEDLITTPAFENFEQLFPPQSGFSNSFLFEDLLNFDLQW